MEECDRALISDSFYDIWLAGLRNAVISLNQDSRVVFSDLSSVALCSMLFNAVLLCADVM